MRLSRILILLMGGILLSACSPVGATPIVAMPVETSPPTLTAPSPTKTPIPTQTSAPTFTVGAPTLMVDPTPRPILQLCSPLAEQTLAEMPEIVSDPYNPPRAGKDDRHHGTDFAYYRRKDRTTIAGEIVQALLPGKVILVINDRLPYGNMVMIETLGTELPLDLALDLGITADESLYHLYAHFQSNPLVVVDQQVECGQALGEVGATGYNIVNPHLHLETRRGLAGADFSQGMAYYTTSASEVERSNYEWWRTSGEFRHFDPMSLIDWYLQNSSGN